MTWKVKTNKITNGPGSPETILQIIIIKHIFREWHRFDETPIFPIPKIFDCGN